MTEREIEDLFLHCYNKEKNLLDIDFMEKFINNSVNGLIRRHGREELSSVLFLQLSENENIDTELRWIQEVGCLLNLYYQKLDSKNLKIIQSRLMAILYILNQIIAKRLVKENFLPANCNIFYSYTDLAILLESSQSFFMQSCFDVSTNSVYENAKERLYNACPYIVIEMLLPNTSA